MNLYATLFIFRLKRAIFRVRLEALLPSWALGLLRSFAPARSLAYNFGSLACFPFASSVVLCVFFFLSLSVFQLCISYKCILMHFHDSLLLAHCVHANNQAEAFCLLTTHLLFIIRIIISVAYTNTHDFFFLLFVFFTLFLSLFRNLPHICTFCRVA